MYSSLYTSFGLEGVFRWDTNSILMLLIDRLIRMRPFWFMCCPDASLYCKMFTRLWVGAVGSNSRIVVLLPYLPAETRPSVSVTPWSQSRQSQRINLACTRSHPFIAMPAPLQKGTIFRLCCLQLVTACTAVIERCTLW
jgi:hypothetical protein